MLLYPQKDQRASIKPLVKNANRGAKHAQSKSQAEHRSGKERRWQPKLAYTAVIVSGMNRHSKHIPNGDYSPCLPIRPARTLLFSEPITTHVHQTACLVRGRRFFIQSHSLMVRTAASPAADVGFKSRRGHQGRLHSGKCSGP